MPKKKLPLLLKFSILLKLSIFLSKLKKPIIPMLVTLKKTGKLKRFKLLKHYNSYNYIKEYEFSPSNTPLIRFNRKTKIERISFKKMYSDVVLMSRCLGMVRGEDDEMGLETLPCAENSVELSEYSFSCNGDSVDERAERFIQRFYEEMRRQRQESSFQMNAMIEM